MEPNLIETLIGYGPWGVALAILALMRKEIAAVITAPKDDRAVEALLAEMNRQFAANMEMFHVTNGHLASAKTDIANQVEITRDILAELLRQTEILRVKR